MPPVPEDAHVPVVSLMYAGLLCQGPDCCVRGSPIALELTCEVLSSQKARQTRLSSGRGPGRGSECHIDVLFPAKRTPPTPIRE